MDENPYTILGVSETASLSQIKAAYRKLALKHHPDRQTDEASKARATPLFAKISNAYEMIGDEQNRRKYDLQQSQAAAAASDDAFYDHHHSPFYHSQSQFHDPFEVFRQAFGEEFGSAPRSHRASGFMQDPFFMDPFGGGGFGAFGGGGGFGAFGGGGGFGAFGGGDPFGHGGGQDLFSSMNRQMEMMAQQQQQAAANGRGGFSSFTTSSSSSSSTSFRGGNRESVSTTTRIINGKRQTITERVITRPDGTTERTVETTGDDDFPTAAAAPPHIEGHVPWGQLPPSSAAAAGGGSAGAGMNRGQLPPSAGRRGY